MNLTHAEVEQRMAEFRSKRIAHRIVKEVRRHLFDRLLTTEKELVLALIGPSGVGKTATRRAVQEMLIQHYQQQMIDDPGFVPFLTVTAVTGLGGDFNWKDGFARLLASGNEPLIPHKTFFPELQLDGQAITTTKGLIKDEFRRAFESMVKHRRIRIIFLEEASSVIDETVNRHPLRQFNILKSLAVELGIIIVMIGAYDLIGLKDGNGQLIRRSEIIHMPRYQLDVPEPTDPADPPKETPDSPDFNQFRAAARGLASVAPVRIDPSVLSDMVWVFMMCVGCFGVFRDWLDRACVDALLHHDGVLTEETFALNALPIHVIEKLVQEAQLGETQMIDSPEIRIAELYGRATLRSPLPTPERPSQNKKKRGQVGRRRPSRDPVGMQHA